MNDLDKWNIYVSELSFVGVDFGISPLAATSNGKLFVVDDLLDFVISIKNIDSSASSLKILFDSADTVSQETKSKIESDAIEEKTNIITDRIKMKFGDLFKNLLNYKVIGIENFYAGGNIGGVKLYEMMNYQSSYEALYSDLENEGKAVYRIPCNLTSKTCSYCGYIYKKKPGENEHEFDQRSPFIIGKIFVCPICECIFDRDINAANNIKNGAISKYFEQRSISISNSTLFDYEKNMALEHNQAYLEAYIGNPNIIPEHDLWYFEEGQKKFGFLKNRKSR